MDIPFCKEKLTSDCVSNSFNQLFILFLILLTHMPSDPMLVSNSAFRLSIKQWNSNCLCLRNSIDPIQTLLLFLSHPVVNFNSSIEQRFRQSWQKATQIVSHIWGKIYELFLYNKSHLRPVGGSSGKMPAVSMPDENILMVLKIFCLFCSFNLFFQSVGYLINHARMSCNLFGVVICVCWPIVAMD